MLPFFEALNEMGISIAIRESLWMVSVINAAHLLFVVMFVGAVLIVDLRLLGRSGGSPHLSEVALDAQPWLIIALAGLTVTGIPQILSNALREYHSYLFWMKMAILLVALIYTFTLRRRVTLAAEGRIPPAMRRIVGVVSIALWTGVIIPARLIGLFT